MYLNITVQVAFLSVWNSEGGGLLYMYHFPSIGVFAYTNHVKDGGKQISFTMII